MKKIFVTILILATFVAVYFGQQAVFTAKGEGCDFTKVMSQNNSELGKTQEKAKALFENIELENLTIENIDIETIEIEKPITCGQAKFSQRKLEPRPWIEDVFDWITFWD